MTVPDGSANSFTESDQLGWVALNMDYPIEKWSTVVNLAQLRKVKVIPWIRLARIPEGETIVNVKARLQTLVDTARIWNTDWILPNYEDEASTMPPALVRLALEETNWVGYVGWSTQGWLPNDVNYQPIAGDPVLLQIFPTDLHWPKDYATIKQKMGDCVAHARQHGFAYVGVTYQTYDNATPALYDVESYQHSVFPGNLIQAGQWASWYA